jgi:hypothetical protein
MRCLYWSLGVECFNCGEREEIHADGETDLNLRTVREILRENRLLDISEDGIPVCTECGTPAAVWWTGVEDHARLDPF